MSTQHSSTRHPLFTAFPDLYGFPIEISLDFHSEKEYTSSHILRECRGFACDKQTVVYWFLADQSPLTCLFRWHSGTEVKSLLHSQHHPSSNGFLTTCFNSLHIYRMRAYSQITGHCLSISNTWNDTGSGKFQCMSDDSFYMVATDRIQRYVSRKTKQRFVDVSLAVWYLIIHLLSFNLM